MGVALLSSMRNEGPYIVEWVAHHRAIGFANLVVGWNDCADGTDRILARLEALGVVRQFATRPVPGRSFQHAALAEAARSPEAAAADWLCACDADEFLNVHVGDRSVGALVAASGVSDRGRPADVIAVPWRVFGNGGVGGIADRPVTRQFLRAETPAGRRWGGEPLVKSLWRNLGPVLRPAAHHPVAGRALGRPLVRVAPGGAEIPPGCRPQRAPSTDFRVAQVNHYALRSLDVFLVKKDRGPGHTAPDRYTAAFWRRHDATGMEETTILATAPAREGLAGAFLADPLLARLQAEAVAWHRARAAELRRLPENAAILAAAAGAGIGGAGD